MSAPPDDWLSGKGSRDENFPVASMLIEKRFRPAVLAFYRFARAADDAADDPALSASERLRILGRLEATLCGDDDLDVAIPLRRELATHGMGARHALDLLKAFRRDVREESIQTFDDLMDYCTVSAMPVGRFVLDLHGEDRNTWALSDALCAALQIINHLQDCAKDHRELGRVYMPADYLRANGAEMADLGLDRSTPGLSRTLAQLLDEVASLLSISAPLAPMVENRRLGLEIAVIQRLAEKLVHRLRRCDPLTDDVHPGRFAVASTACGAIVRHFFRRREPSAPRAAGSQGAGVSVSCSGADLVVEAPRRSSFFLALRILPACQREAMYAVYGFCRAVDDIADGTASHAERIADLERWRAAIAALYAGEPPPTPLLPLARAIASFDLAREDFEAIVDGMAMDVREECLAPNLATFELYVDRVAAAPGRLSVRVFGLGVGEGRALAHHLGRALQITNVLRDLDEDADRARLYLPREMLTEAGFQDRLLEIERYRDTDGQHASSESFAARVRLIRHLLADARIAEPCHRLSVLARTHFEHARAIMDASPRHAVRAPRLMDAAYAALADDLAARGWHAPRRKVPKRNGAVVAALLRHGFF